MKGRDLPLRASPDTLEIDGYWDHLENVDRTLEESRATQSLRFAGQALLEASAKPIILLELDLKILARNAVAESVLQARTLVYEEHGRLCCQSAKSASDLRLALQTLQRRLTAEGVGGPRKAIALSLEAADCKSGRAFASLWAVPAARFGGLGDSRPIAVLTITAERAEHSIAPVFVKSVFALTPAEAKLTALLVAGEDLHVIAATQHLSIETLRAQLKSVFIKTNTHRQSDLVSLFLRFNCY
jgi:DNA-binding CsgD family transcriptional regulator